MAHGYAELSRKTEGRLIADPRLLIRMSLVRAHHEEPVEAVSERFAEASKGLLTGVASLLGICHGPHARASEARIAAASAASSNGMNSAISGSWPRASTGVAATRSRGRRPSMKAKTRACRRNRARIRSALRRSRADVRSGSRAAARRSIAIANASTSPMVRRDSPSCSPSSYPRAARPRSRCRQTTRVSGAMVIGDGLRLMTTAG